MGRSSTARVEEPSPEAAPQRPPWPAIDDIPFRSGTNVEVIDGEVVVMPGAEGPHGDEHFDLATLLGAVLAPGFVGSAELFTRPGYQEVYAPDVSIRPEGKDPRTGGRHLESLVFEVHDKGDLKRLTHKARTLAKRGVRRVFCIDVRHPDAPGVAEWDRRRGAWSALDLDGTLTDPCFLVPVPVRALVDKVLAELTVARGLLARGNPVLQRALADERAQGHATGHATGQRQGHEQGLTEGVAQGLGPLMHLCGRRLGRELTDDERAVLAQRLAEQGPVTVGDRVLEDAPEVLARWLQSS
jgi:Uma2 family endonuclease